VDILFQWITQTPVAGLVLIVLVVIIVLAIVIIYLFAFIQGREISLWPPKIGPKSFSGDSDNSTLPTGDAQDLQIELKHSTALRAVEKPFEGEWDYLSDYENYYKEPKPRQLHGVGTAIVLWKCSKNVYDVDISYSIKRDHVESPLAVIVFKGKLAADSSGWPSQQPFIINADLLHRLHYKGEIHNLRKYQFKDCFYTKSASDGQPETITCEIESEESKSRVTFTKKAGIH
jgi:hypothetical protein